LAIKSKNAGKKVNRPDVATGGGMGEGGAKGGVGDSAGKGVGGKAGDGLSERAVKGGAKGGVSAWQNFAIGSQGRMGGRDAETGFFTRREIRDNNTRFGRDRYGSRREIKPPADEGLDSGFRYNPYNQNAAGGAGRSADKASGRTYGKTETTSADSSRKSTDFIPESIDSKPEPIVSKPETGRSKADSAKGKTFLGKIAFAMNINAFTAPAYFIKLMLAIALSFSVVYAMVKTSGLEIPAYAIFLACAAFMLAFSVMFINIVVANGIILSSIAAFSLYVFYLFRVDKFNDFRIYASYYLRRFMFWAGSFFFTGQPHMAHFEFILFIIVCALICLTVFFVAVKKYIFALMFAIGFATFCTQWCYGFFAGLAPFFIFIITTIVGYIWHIYLKNRNQYGDWSAMFPPAKFMKSLIPLYVFMFAAIAASPVPNGPIRMQWLYDIVNDITEGFNDRFYYYRVDTFALNTTGFSNGESFLSGPVRLNNTQVLTVATDDRTLYLKGNGKETYTGYSWKNPQNFVWKPSAGNGAEAKAPESLDDKIIYIDPNELFGTEGGGNPPSGGSDTRGADSAGYFESRVYRITDRRADSDKSDDNASAAGGGKTAVEASVTEVPWGIKMPANYRYGNSNSYVFEFSGASIMTQEANASAVTQEANASAETQETKAGLNSQNAQDNVKSQNAQDAAKSQKAAKAAERAAFLERADEQAKAEAEEAKAAKAAEAKAAGKSGNAAPGKGGNAAPDNSVNANAASNNSGNVKAAAETRAAKHNRLAAQNNAAPPAGAREKSVTDLESPDLTDIRDMEEALKRMDTGIPSRIPGSYYLDGDTEVDLDVAEYRQNHLLFLYRLLAGGLNPSPARIGANAFDLRFTGRRMLNRDILSASVQFDRMKTYSLFIPSKLIKIQSVNTQVGHIYEDNGALSMEQIMAEGFCYYFDYYPDDRNDAAARLLLGNSYQGLYRDMLGDCDDTFILSYANGGVTNASGSAAKTSGNDANASGGVTNASDSSANASAYLMQIGDFIDRDDLAGLADRADNIRRRYTTLPDTLPDRVWILAEQLTESAATDFEKAELLEHYLYANYDYSLNVGYLRSGEDFVDNFLFSLSEGYCTHFASALAVMARCVGLPARYVEGYTMPEEPGEDGYYVVTNAEAHAWVEIYFEGYGWRRFEPTATYQDRFLTPVVDEGTRIAGASGMGGDYYNYMEDMMREQDYFSYSGAFDFSGPGVDSRRSEIIDGLVKAALVVFACSIPIGIALFGRRRANKRFSSFSSAPGLAVFSMYKHYLKILRMLRYTIGNGETLSQYAARVDGGLKIGESGLAESVDVFEKMIYSKHELTESDKQRARAVYPKLLTAYSLRKNKFTFFIMKDLIAVI